MDLGTFAAAEQVDCFSCQPMAAAAAAPDQPWARKFGHLWILVRRVRIQPKYTFKKLTI